MKHKKGWIWIYEYKDDDELVGATFYEGYTIDLNEDIKLPKLRGDWYWRIETSWRD